MGLNHGQIRVSKVGHLKVNFRLFVDEVYDDLANLVGI